MPQGSRQRRAQRILGDCLSCVSTASTICKWTDYKPAADWSCPHAGTRRLYPVSSAVYIPLPRRSLLLDERLHRQCTDRILAKVYSALCLPLLYLSRKRELPFPSRGLRSAFAASTPHQQHGVYTAKLYSNAHATPFKGLPSKSVSIENI